MIITMLSFEQIDLTILLTMVQGQILTDPDQTIFRKGLHWTGSAFLYSFKRILFACYEWRKSDIFNDLFKLLFSVKRKDTLTKVTYDLNKFSMYEILFILLIVDYLMKYVAYLVTI